MSGRTCDNKERCPDRRRVVSISEVHLYRLLIGGGAARSVTVIGMLLICVVCALLFEEGKHSRV